MFGRTPSCFEAFKSLWPAMDASYEVEAVGGGFAALAYKRRLEAAEALKRCYNAATRLPRVAANEVT